MLSCETCRAQMLEYLYDLLEGDEQQALTVHLNDCPPCQAELVKAKAQQQLLATAAKMDFPDVRFTAPPVSRETGNPKSEIRKAVPRFRFRVSGFGFPAKRVVAAAAILLVLGAAVPTVWYGRAYLHTKQLVTQGEARIAQAKMDRADAQVQIARTLVEKKERTEAIHAAQRAAQLQVKVQGPATMRVGAPTDYQIFTTNLNRQPTPAKLSVQVTDRGKSVGKPIEVASAGAGVYRLTLPADLPVRPDSQPALMVSASRDNGSHVDLREEMQLAAPVYVTHLEMDKPMYQQGETVHFRSLTLDRFSLKPAEQELHVQYVLTIPGGQQRIVAQGKTILVADGKNGHQEVLGPDQKPLRGIGAGSFALDEGWGGGEYSLTVREMNQRFPEQRRKFLVNKYNRPNLNKELDFSRKSYGPGDEVAARCKANYLDGRPVKNCRVQASVTIDGKQYGAQGEDSREAFGFQTDDNGVVNVRFKLPKEIERGLGSLTVNFADVAMPDTIVRPLPIVLKKLNIEFSPEGGDLVAGLLNRVYFQVRSTLGKPADLRGQLLEDGKPLGVTVETLASEKTPELNQGMGRFEFKPQSGHKYELKVESPVGVTQRYQLPDVKPEGIVLSIPQGVVGANATIPVTVRSTAKRSLMVGAYCRGRLLDSTELSQIHFVGAEAHAVLTPTSGAGGVCRVTVFEVLPGDATRRTLRPVAERLIYRQPAERVRLALQPDQQTYVPRQTVKLGVEAKNEKGEPTPAVVLLRVVDKSVVTLADDKTVRSMPTHFLLTTEVRRPEDLEYADFLLGSHPQAAEALDLLLGTQGWRRFAEQNPRKFLHEQKEEAERLLLVSGQSQPRMTDLTEQELARVDAETIRRATELRAQAAQARKAEEEARADRDYRAALVKLGNYNDFFRQARVVGAPLLGALLILTALVFLILGLFRKLVRALPYYAATVACVMVVVLLAKMSDVTPLRPRSDNQQIAQMSQPSEARTERAARDDQAKGEADGFADKKDENKLNNLARAAEKAPRMARAPAAPPPGMPGKKMADKGQGMPERKRAEGKGNGMAKPEQFRGLGMAKDGKAAFGVMRAPQAMKKADRADKPGMMGGRMMPPAGAGRRFKMEAADARAGAKMKQLQEQIAWSALPVRVFAHSRASGPAEVRYDFAETLYWHPVLVLDGGKGEVSFDLCDSLGAFEVTAFAHTLDGRLGSATQTLTSRLPFTVQPRTPLEVTAGDKIDIALAVANNTSDTRTAHISVTEHANLSLMSGSPTANVSVPSEAAIRKLYRFQPTVQEGRATLNFTGKADGFPADSVRTSFRIVPEGFPVVGSHSDLLEKSATKNVVLPETWIKSTLKCQVQVYPSTLADLQKGLESLLREPCGCFEQTSTSNYPNLLILQYLKESDQTKPAVERRAHELLDRGYQKLTSFECTNPAKRAKEGYEWFGGTAPAHEALTAYGLMEFRDMAKVHEVDPAMMKRTQEYLLRQRDGKGGFKRNPRALDTFGRAPDHVTNAYIVWALTEGGKDDDIMKELNTLSEQAKTSKDPYFLSLVANSLINRAKTADATVLLKKVVALQKADGHLDAAQTSITGSGGRDLQIETTSLAMLGWLKANPGEFNGSVQKAIHWLGQQRGGYGGFGSTQSTILALKALILYTKANKKTPEAGELQLFVGETQVAALPFAAGATEPLTLKVPNAETTLKPGKNPVRVEITGKNAFPYTLTWTYQTRQPVSADKCPVKLAAKLDRQATREGETVRLNVRVENASGKGQGMTVAILGLPGGLTIPEDMKQLKDYTLPPTDGKRPLLSYFEIRGRELVLYWRDLAPDQKIEVPIDLICRVPGEYSGPASRAYLYYNADRKHWVEPLKVNIAAKAE